MINLKLKKTLILIIIIISILYGKVINLIALGERDIINVYTWGYLYNNNIIIKNGTIWVAGESFLYKIKINSEELIAKYGINDNQPFNSTRTLAINNDDTIFSSELYQGRHYILQLNENGLFIKNSKNFHYLNSLQGLTILPDNKLLVNGLYEKNYVAYLDKYDENTKSPSIESKKRFDQYYESYSPSTLTLLDSNLEIIKTINKIKLNGRELWGYINLFFNEIIDVDNKHSIYTIYKPMNYLIRKYSSDFELLFEFEGHNDHFKPIPDKLTKAKAKRMRNVPGTFSNIYSIIVINDTIITSFYQNPKNWDIPSSPFYFDVFNQEGEKLHTGTIPYRIFTKDNENNLYFMVKKEGGWFLGKDQYYLVSFTLNDLMNCSINEEWVDNAIQEYLDEK